jgi:hypothetical protein
MPCAIFMFARLGSVLAGGLIAGAAVQAAGNSRHTDAGDLLSFALPAAVAGYEAYQGDRQGLVQFGLSWSATLLATEALKRTTQRSRPDGSNRLSFPSGHASRAFGAAAYVHRRHGLDAAWPLYLASTYVGWSRVQAERHYWRDVAGSAALSVGMAWWLVEPGAVSTQISAGFEGGRTSVWLQRQF